MTNEEERLAVGYLGTIVGPAARVPEAEARRIAAELQAGEETGWTYKALKRGSHFVVAAYDEEDRIVGFF